MALPVGYLLQQENMRVRDQNKWHCRAQPSCHQATCRYVFRQMLQRQYYVMLIMVTCSSLAAIATARSVPITKSLTGRLMFMVGEDGPDLLYLHVLLPGGPLVRAYRLPEHPTLRDTPAQTLVTLRCHLRPGALNDCMGVSEVQVASPIATRARISSGLGGGTTGMYDDEQLPVFTAARVPTAGTSAADESYGDSVGVGQGRAESAVGVRLRVLVMVSSWVGSALCTRPVGVAAEQVDNYFRNNTGVFKHFERCSYGTMTFDDYTFTVLETPITCMNTFLTRCSDLDINTMMERAKRIALDALGADRFAAFNRFSLVMPRDTYGACPWGGKAYRPGVDTWYGPDHVAYPGVVMHEMLHTYGLSHGYAYNTSGSLVEYMDGSDVMALGQVCPTAPQLWRLGWAKPVANLNTKSMRAGSTRVFRLPATFMSQKSYIRIQPDWLGDAYDKNLYLSLRSAGGGDVLLDANPRASYRATLAQAAIQHFGDVLSVHQGDRLVEADRLMWQQRNPVYTALAAVEPDSSLHLPQYMLRIGVRGLSAGPRVMVRLCRYTESEDTCTV